MTLLDDIIDGATDDAVTTANLLRKVQVVTHRLGAEEIKNWVQQELTGYASVDELPNYRANLVVNVMGTWSGPMGSTMTQALSVGRIPEKAVNALFRVNVSQSLAELEQLASLKNDPSVPWDPIHVTWYNKWAEDGIVPHIEFYGLLSANRYVTRAMLSGVIDAARNTALEFALQLQSAAPDAGSKDGPTVDQEPVARVIYNVQNHIYGDGAQVAQGQNIRQRSKVVKGDLAGLIQAARAAGLTAEGEAELARVVLSEDDGKRPRRVQAFLKKVREGAFLVGTGITAEVAASELSDLISGFIG